MKAVLLNSGGKDSLATAILLAQEGNDLHSFTVDMGQPEGALGHPAAQKIAQKYCRSHHVLKVTSGPYLSPTTKLPEGWNYTTIPFKAIVMWSLGAMYAVTIGAEAVASGMRADIFPEDFAKIIEGMLALSVKVRDPLKVIVPLDGYKGRQGELNDIVFNIIKYDPLWRETSYCNDDPACGVCYGCRVRADWLSRV